MVIFDGNLTATKFENMLKNQIYPTIPWRS